MGFLLLVTAGLFRSGRIMRPEHLRYAAIWTAIVGVLALGFAYRDQLSEAPRRLKLAFSAGDPVTTGPGEVVVPRDESGHYIVVARVNGQRVRFLVDTGATDTVLSRDDAQRIGLPLQDLRYVRAVETANGLGYAAPFVADRFEVGPIALADFSLAVNQAPMSISLLGMSFLSRLDSFHFEGPNLVLRWREGG
jgi:aspartyl protease family protein